jgi:hypothetical protein
MDWLSAKHLRLGGIARKLDKALGVAMVSEINRERPSQLFCCFGCEAQEPGPNSYQTNYSRSPLACREQHYAIGVRVKLRHFQSQFSSFNQPKP